LYFLQTQSQNFTDKGCSSLMLLRKSSIEYSNTPCGKIKFINTNYIKFKLLYSDMHLFFCLVPSFNYRWKKGGLMEIIPWCLMVAVNNVMNFATPFRAGCNKNASILFGSEFLVNINLSHSRKWFDKEAKCKN
jgi:hypothetical protein